MPPNNLDFRLTVPSDDVIIHRADGTDVAVVTIKNLWLCYDKLTLKIQVIMKNL